MANTTTKRIQPGTFTLTLGVLLLLFGAFALVTTGNQVFISLGILLLGAGFMGYIFQNDVFDITLGVVATLAVLVLILYQIQSHFLPATHAPAETAAEVKH